MALRDQPFLPLYVQDFLTDEKLNECSAEATGVYIKIMCLMHKSKTYGKILLRQNYQQILQQTFQQSDRHLPEFCRNFAGLVGAQLSRHLPFSAETIGNSVAELLSENVLTIEDFFLCQKRMIKDNRLSIIRSGVGRKGAEVTNRKFAAANDPANDPANQTANDPANIPPNTENESEYENNKENLTTIVSSDSIGNTEITINEEAEINGTNLCPRMISTFKAAYPEYPIDIKSDFTSALNIAKKIATWKHWSKESVTNSRVEQTMDVWRKIVEFSKTDKWFSTRPVSDFDKEFQRLIQKMTNNGSANQSTATNQQSNGSPNKLTKSNLSGGSFGTL